MIDYDSFSRCHLTDIFFRFSRGIKRVKGFQYNFDIRQQYEFANILQSFMVLPP